MIPLQEIISVGYRKGFTIVELLITIVVIGILAAIVIIAYTGINVRANASAAKANAQSVQAVTEAYTQDSTTGGNGSYAASTAALSSWNGGVSRIPSGVTLVTTQLTAYVAGQIQYINKGTTGACIGYWNPSLGTPAAVYMYAGNATTGTNAATPTCT